jgi:hypothetical protein
LVAFFIDQKDCFDYHIPFLIPSRPSPLIPDCIDIFSPP